MGVFIERLSMFVFSIVLGVNLGIGIGGAVLVGLLLCHPWSQSGRRTASTGLK